MDNDIVIKAENLSKKFTIDLRKSMIYGTVDLTKNILGFPSKRDKLRKSEFWAVKDVNLEIRRGEVLGLIGRNGSGKSTFLRLLSGIYPPDKGRVSIKGRVGALIAVGAGFHPHMTGRENIYLNGTILGLKKKEIDREFDSIVDFAEVGKFIDAPVNTYSSGMRVRLGFAIAVHAVPDILLVDEVLSVGDLRFQQKSMSKIAEIVESGTTIIFVSHNMTSIQRVTNKAVLLEKGQIYAQGPTEEIIGEYYKLNSGDGRFKKESLKIKNTSSYGITYEYLRFFNEAGEETRKFKTGEDVTVEWSFKMPKPLDKVSLNFVISDGPFTWNGYSTVYDDVVIEKLDNNTKIKLKLKNVGLSTGRYHVSIGIWDEKFIGSYFWDYESTGTIEFESDKIMQGRFGFEHEWEIGQKG